MTPAELIARRDRVQILDVRWQDEWEAGRIAGSVHLPQDELDGRFDELDRDRPVIAVCRSGSRSSFAAGRLRDEGFDAENLDGGLEAWLAEGLPFEGELAEPEAGPEGHERLQAEFLGVLMDVQAQFGDREASDEEIRAFLRRRLIDEGRSPQEADEFLAGLDDADDQAGEAGDQ